MVKVAIIGLGKVGSCLAFCLSEENFELLLAGRSMQKAEGIKMDLMGAFPETGGRMRPGACKRFLKKRKANIV